MYESVGVLIRCCNCIFTALATNHGLCRRNVASIHILEVMIANDLSMTTELMPWNGILLMTDMRMT